MIPKLLGAFAALLILAGCQAAPTPVAPSPASRMALGGADEAPVTVGLVVLSGSIVDPTEPEGFATDATTP